MHFLLAGAEQVSHTRKTKFFNTKIYFRLRNTICWEVLIAAQRVKNVPSSNESIRTEVVAQTVF